MRVIIQRCKESEVKVNDKIVGKIDHGYVILVGFTQGDNKELVKKMANKIINLRIFNDEEEKMNYDIKKVNGKILSISQFTLYAKLDGRRPSFSNALNYKEASELYDYFNETLRNFNIDVQTGIFGEDMKVKLINDGPVTIIIDSKEDLWKGK